MTSCFVNKRKTQEMNTTKPKTLKDHCWAKFHWLMGFKKVSCDKSTEEFVFSICASPRMFVPSAIIPALRSLMNLFSFYFYMNLFWHWVKSVISWSLHNFVKKSESEKHTNLQQAISRWKMKTSEVVSRQLIQSMKPNSCCLKMFSMLVFF